MSSGFVARRCDFSDGPHRCNLGSKFGRSSPVCDIYPSWLLANDNDNQGTFVNCAHMSAIDNDTFRRPR
ncbi:hypothetical protein TIFTF001_055605 [Ficus carica]|uniref:Uncharacterized protein n=1 Tax=Ficus carica TaxID=3494 RepID=A0AA88ECX5_FICCA|nr:hypothetical protein TIFTF001_055605 [Ficus carica]